MTRRPQGCRKGETMGKRGDFTLPGEAGFEQLTLKMAEKWGADVIRDSDGTKLSEDITKAGYGIYSTICVIRSDNAWAKENRDKLQQNFLMSEPVAAEGSEVRISLLKGYFTQQFTVNTGEDSVAYWQVFDRTTGEEVPREKWSLEAETGTVLVKETIPWHTYTVNFLAIRLWEEISMYNHITNDWGDKEHLMAVDPRYPETQEHMKAWLEDWCRKNPDTTVVRFTSMFYNFAWFWKDDKKCRDAFSDWGSYAMTTTPLALKLFEEKKGYAMTSEDFVNAGLYTSTHNVPTRRYRDWMDFINEFVVSFGKQLIDIVHRYGKKAFVFYDDSWIGVEPYGKRFPEFGFDGIIKCVFNGFEARLCANVPGVSHELRFHPYLFPTGLTGEPTFAPGGNPKLDASRYWVNVRRALLRQPVDRIGLGGYLHLVEPFPDFCDYIAEVADEFRLLKSFNASCVPYTIPGKIVVLTAWGSLRSWICSGHLHEHPEVDLTNILESLSGLPFDVCFMSFDDLEEKGLPEDAKVVINAGVGNSAWSGGDNWRRPGVIEKLTKFVHDGGGLLGVNDPSGLDAFGKYFQLAMVLGVDRDLGTKKCIGKYRNKTEESSFALADTPDLGCELPEKEGVYCLNAGVKVLASRNGTPVITLNSFGKGKAMYLSGFRTSRQASRFLLRALLTLSGREELISDYICDNLNTECAYYGEIDRLVVINNTETEQTANIKTAKGKISLTLEPFSTKIL